MRRCWHRCYPRPRRPAGVSPPKEGCTVEWSKIWSIQPIPFDPQLIELCDQAVRETAGKSHQVPSGPLHDAAEVARAGIPVVMMFTQSLNGLSHNPAENTRTDHLELAVQAYDLLARKTIRWLLESLHR